MPTVRLSTKEVQVNDAIYFFDIVQVADAFEACVAAADAEHCALCHPPASRRMVELDDPPAREEA